MKWKGNYVYKGTKNCIFPENINILLLQWNICQLSTMNMSFKDGVYKILLAYKVDIIYQNPTY